MSLPIYRILKYGMRLYSCIALCYVFLTSSIVGYEEIDNVPDRLRWCRQSRGLMQTEVADRVGMSHNVYKVLISALGRKEHEVLVW